METQIHARDELITVIQSLTGQANLLTVPRELSRFLGDDLPAALLLSQLIYWQGKQGRVDGAIYKTYAEWYEEIGLTEYQVRRATKKMSEFLRTKIHRANGSPTVHYYLNVGHFSESILKFLKDRYLSFSRNETEVSQDSLTETTSETTSETTTGIEEEGEDNHHHPAADIITFFQEEMKIDRINPAMERELGDLVENFPPERVRAAITAAALHRVKSPIPYVRKALENERDGKEKEKGSAEEKPSTPTDEKFAFKHAPNVLLTESEVLDLVDRFGSPGTEARIDDMSLYKGQHDKKYASDYFAILRWDKGNPWDGTEWDPPDPGWNIKLDGVRAKLAPQPAARQSITLAEWFKLWSEDYLKDATVGTQSFYNQTFVTHVLPALGDIPLQELTRSWVRLMLDAVPTNSQGFPGRNRIRGALQDCLAGAIDKGLLDTNPASRFEYVDSVCKWCNRVFRAQKPKDGGPPSDHCNRMECVDKDREELRRRTSQEKTQKPEGTAGKASSTDQYLAELDRRVREDPGAVLAEIQRGDHGAHG